MLLAMKTRTAERTMGTKREPRVTMGPQGVGKWRPGTA
jgi:hypothetical protein